MGMRKLLLIISLLVIGNCFGQSPMFKLIAKNQSASCTYILDTYTGSAGAYSVAFKLRSAYSGSAFRVRRSSDNTEQDIGFVGCHVDTASLKSFVGSNSGYIVTLYDQEGSNNVTQSTSSLQARIVNAGVVERVSGQPSMYMSASQYNFSQFANRSRLDIYYLASPNDNTYMHFNSGGDSYSYVADNGSSVTTLYARFGTPSLYTNGSLFSGTTRGDVYTAFNGAKIICIQEAATNVGWSGVFNASNYGSGFQFTGYLSQIIGWNSDQSANRSGIVSAFNTQFSIY